MSGTSRERPVVMALTGASGAPYGIRLLEWLLENGHDVSLSISPSGRAVLKQELDLDISLESFSTEQLWRTSQNQSWWSRFGPPQTSTREQLASRAPAFDAKLNYYHYQDFMAPMASGSHLTAGMVICPCSGGTLSGVVCGASSNLIERAAEVHLKERRKLILVTREAPLSLVHVNNLRKAVEAGAVVLPAMPGWYHGVQSIHDLIDFIVARILDQLEISHTLMKRWGGESSDV